MLRQDVIWGGALTLLTVLGGIYWSGITHAQIRNLDCGVYRADWSDARAFSPGCIVLGPPPAVAPLGAELAPRLAAAGASTDELIRACGMTEDEAELVMRLHGRGEA